jgi:tRNA 2-thiouridine synthesizing protein A
MTMDIDTLQSDQILDTRGLTCPMPLLKTKKALKGMQASQILEVLGDDPGSKNDIPGWAAKKNNEFLGMTDTDEGYTRYFIKKG